MNKQFWNKKRVFITGHTGFKGSWLSLLLSRAGANLFGYALKAPDESLFRQAEVEKTIKSNIGDIRNLDQLVKTMKAAKPEIVFHLAAQPLVRESYKDPIYTYGVNVMGTANLLEAVRQTSSVRAVVVVTSDKCYKNNEWVWGYRESDPMGGHDPYSSSKGCAELITSAYQASYFSPQNGNRQVAIATARAGNVIGGGDWNKDRLIPDIIRALKKNKPVSIRNPQAIRPWQHVLDPLNGYILLAEKLYGNERNSFAQAWNFGPSQDEKHSVSKVVKNFIKEWGSGKFQEKINKADPHEAACLTLDSSKARNLLNWKPQISISDAVQATAGWYRAQLDGTNMAIFTRNQIDNYQKFSNSNSILI